MIYTDCNITGVAAFVQHYFTKYFLNTNGNYVKRCSMKMLKKVIK